MQFFRDILSGRVAPVSIPTIPIIKPQSRILTKTDEISKIRFFSEEYNAKLPSHSIKAIKNPEDALKKVNNDIIELKKQVETRKNELIKSRETLSDMKDEMSKLNFTFFNIKLIHVNIILDKQEVKLQERFLKEFELLLSEYKEEKLGDSGKAVLGKIIEQFKPIEKGLKLLELIQAELSSREVEAKEIELKMNDKLPSSQNKVNIVMEKIVSQLGEKIEVKPLPTKHETLLTTTLDSILLTKKINELDSLSNPIKVAMSQLPRREELNIDTSSLKKEMEEVNKFETDFVKKYGKDLQNTGWHGVSSFQRILFQDSDFIKLAQNSSFIKALLARENEYTISIGPPKCTLSSLFRYGLLSNDLSYLSTVSPNWMHKPKDIEWKDFGYMGNQIPSDAPPLLVNENTLTDMTNGFVTILQTLKDIHPITVSKSNDTDLFMEQIRRAPADKLLICIDKLMKKLDDKTINILTSGAAGASTEWRQMGSQALDVVGNYHKLLQKHNGDHSAVLGYGLVSHALDARHLSAVLYQITKKTSQSDTRLLSAQAYLKKLIEECQENPDTKLAVLMKPRLQQVLRVMIDNRDKIRLTLEDFRSNL